VHTIGPNALVVNAAVNESFRLATSKRANADLMGLKANAKTFAEPKSKSTPRA